MQINEFKQVKQNLSNPRYILEDKFSLLLKSILQRPDILDIRPIVVKLPENIVLGGNMRHKAILHILDCDLTQFDFNFDIEFWQKVQQGEIPDSWIVFKEMTKHEADEFIIKDNVGFGQWDWDVLANDWSEDDLQDWGLDIPSLDCEIDENEELIDDNEDDTLFKVQIELSSKDEQQSIINELSSKGYSCKALN
jgi:hypothetical protein